MNILNLILRFLLKRHRDNLLQLEFTIERSRIVDRIDYILEAEERDQNAST